MQRNTPKSNANAMSKEIEDIFTAMLTEINRQNVLGALPPRLTAHVNHHTKLSAYKELRPFAHALTAGFWLASRKGLCEKPNLHPLVVNYDPTLSPFIEKNQAERNAAKILIRQGSSVESALQYLFGTDYSEADATDQEQLRETLVAVMNGDVTAEQGERCNAISKMTDATERHQQAIQLSHEIANAKVRRQFGI